MEKAEENYSETVTTQPFLRNAFYVTLGIGWPYLNSYVLDPDLLLRSLSGLSRGRNHLSA
jgi:hypothetical protein